MRASRRREAMKERARAERLRVVMGKDLKFKSLKWADRDFVAAINSKVGILESGGRGRGKGRRREEEG